MKDLHASRCVSSLVIALCMSHPLMAQGLPAANSRELGLSSDGLDAITEYLESEVKAGRIAGAVALVARHGRVGYLEAAGKSSMEADEPMTTDTLFRIASMTKPITSAAVMSLVEDGELRLDDPLSLYLPEFKAPRVAVETAEGSVEYRAARREVTLHDLLTHTSGITYGSSGPEELDRFYREARLQTFVPTDESTGDLVRRIASLPLRFEPGTEWNYGFSTDVLGHLVERVSGLTLRQFLRERFFRPLRMRDTFFHVPEEKPVRLAALYTPGANQRLERVGERPVTKDGMTFTADYCYAGGRRLHSGGGGLVSSIGDYARFLQMMLERGELDGARVLERSTALSMTRHQIGDLSIPDWGHGDGFGYGFGVVTERPEAADIASAGTFGWGGVFNTYAFADPQESLIAVLMTQVYPFDRPEMRSAFKRLVYDSLDDSGFARLYWYEKGIEHGNPFFNQRQLRVSSPEASVHPRFSYRSEPRSSGTMRILVEEDLLKISRADLYLELWGGHPGTANKRVTLNGRYRYDIPEVGCAAGHCTHQYPSFNLPPMGLVNGYNALQFACDLGTTFWGHYIVDNACLRIGLPSEHESIVEAGLSDFDVAVETVPAPEEETIRLRLKGPSDRLDEIAAVHYQGRYLGYDENGNTWKSDWHGMTKERKPYGHVGSSTRAPFELDWKTRMLPAQENVGVRAVLELKNHPDLVYTTRVSAGLEIPERSDRKVTIHYAKDLPDHFWSRANRLKTCHIDLGVDPRTIESAELHVVAWTGGPGKVTDYFKLNGHHFPVADGHGHEVVYSWLAVDPGILKTRDNRIELLSDTEHHGIEILLPGPALITGIAR